MISLFALALAAQPAPAAPATPELNAHFVAAMIQPRLPQRFSPEFALVEAAAADSNLLVLTFEVAPAMIEGQTAESISARLSEGFCSNAQARAVLDGPMSLRPVARTAAGQRLEGTVIESCPAAAAG
jgi:hypothetical protein